MDGNKGMTHMNAAIRTEVGPMVASGKKFDKPTDETLSCLMLVSEALDVFRAVEPSIPSSYIAAFLAVAKTQVTARSTIANNSACYSRSPRVSS